MRAFLGPLDENGRIPAYQQTLVSSFLVSAHGAYGRQLAFALSGRLHYAWQVELHSQFCREMEILSLLARATSWVPVPTLAVSLWHWESTWLPSPADAIGDRELGALIDLAAFGHAIHTVLRPAALLPEGFDQADPFALALRRIEFESGRLMQAQILFLKGPELASVRAGVAAAVERRHAQVRQQWNELLRGMDIETSGRHTLAPAPAYRGTQAAAPASVASDAGAAVRSP